MASLFLKSRKEENIIIILENNDDDELNCIHQLRVYFSDKHFKSVGWLVPNSFDESLILALILKRVVGLLTPINTFL